MSEYKRDEWEQFFVSKARPSLDRFICLKDDKPKVLYDFVYTVHDEFGALPNDWIYKIMSEAFDAACECADLGGWEVYADDCHSDRYKWLDERYADDFIAQAVDEGLVSCGERDIWEIVAAGQYMAKRRIYDLVEEFLGRNSVEYLNTEIEELKYIQDRRKT